MNLDKEIEEASVRIEQRQTEINTELERLVDKIRNYAKWAWRFVWLGGIVAVLSIIYFLCTNTDIGFGLNLLGDFLSGTVASIWSLAALFFIYVAFLGQKQQLLNQQLEIMFSQLEVKYTRLELNGQKEQMIEQNETLKLQKFENTFFQLLTLFNSIVNSLDLRKSRSSSEVFSTGRDCFEVFYKRLLNYLNVRCQSHPGFNFENAKIDVTILAYEDLYSKDKSDMSHYFRTLYHIIKLVDQANIENKSQYTSIVRAQLSSYEQIILFYNCLHDNGNEKFKPLIERYAIFKNIDHSLIINKDHLSCYEKGAYGEVF